MPQVDADQEHTAEGELTLAQAGAANLEYYTQRFSEVRGKTDVTNVDIYLCLIFDSPEQRDEFLVKTGLGQKGDTYVDGVLAAQRLGFPLAPVGIAPKARVTEFDSLAMPIHETKGGEN